MPFTNSVSPLDQKAAKPTGIVVENQRIEDAGKRQEEERKGTLQEDDRRKRGRKGEEVLEDEVEAAVREADGRADTVPLGDDRAEQPGASLEAAADRDVREAADAEPTRQEISEDFEVRRHCTGKTADPPYEGRD